MISSSEMVLFSLCSKTFCSFSVRSDLGRMGFGSGFGFGPGVFLMLLISFFRFFLEAYSLQPYTIQLFHMHVDGFCGFGAGHGEGHGEDGRREM